MTYGIILRVDSANERYNYMVNIDSSNGLLPDSTKPLPEPMLTNVTPSLIGWAHTQNDPCNGYEYLSMQYSHIHKMTLQRLLGESSNNWVGRQQTGPWKNSLLQVSGEEGFVWGRCWTKAQKSRVIPGGCLMVICNMSCEILHWPHFVLLYTCILITFRTHKTDGSK